MRLLFFLAVDRITAENESSIHIAVARSGTNTYEHLWCAACAIAKKPHVKIDCQMARAVMALVGAIPRGEQSTILVHPTSTELGREHMAQPEKKLYTLSICKDHRAMSCYIALLVVGMCDLAAHKLVEVNCASIAPSRQNRVDVCCVPYPKIVVAKRHKQLPDSNAMLQLLAALEKAGHSY